MSFILKSIKSAFSPESNFVNRKADSLENIAPPAHNEERPGDENNELALADKERHPGFMSGRLHQAENLSKAFPKVEDSLADLNLMIKKFSITESNNGRHDTNTLPNDNTKSQLANQKSKLVPGTKRKLEPIYDSTRISKLPCGLQRNKNADLSITTGSAIIAPVCQGVIDTIFNEPGRWGSKFQEPVVQVMQVKDLGSVIEGGVQRYKFFVRDIQNIVQCVLDTKANSFIRNGKLTKGCFLRLKDYEATLVKGKRVLIIQAAEVLENVKSKSMKIIGDQTAITKSEAQDTKSFNMAENSMAYGGAEENQDWELVTYPDDEEWELISALDEEDDELISHSDGDWEVLEYQYND